MTSQYNLTILLIFVAQSLCYWHLSSGRRILGQRYIRHQYFDPERGFFNSPAFIDEQCEIIYNYSEENNEKYITRMVIETTTSNCVSNNNCRIGFRYAIYEKSQENQAEEKIIVSNSFFVTSESKHTKNPYHKDLIIAHSEIYFYLGSHSFNSKLDLTEEIIISLKNNLYDGYLIDNNSLFSNGKLSPLFAIFSAELRSVQIFFEKNLFYELLYFSSNDINFLKRFFFEYLKDNSEKHMWEHVNQFFDSIEKQEVYREQIIDRRSERDQNTKTELQNTLTEEHSSVNIHKTNPNLPKKYSSLAINHQMPCPSLDYSIPTIYVKKPDNVIWQKTTANDFKQPDIYEKEHILVDSGEYKTPIDSTEQPQHTSEQYFPDKKWTYWDQQRAPLLQKPHYMVTANEKHQKVDSYSQYTYNMRQKQPDALSSEVLMASMNNFGFPDQCISIPNSHNTLQNVKNRPIHMARYSNPFMVGHTESIINNFGPEAEFNGHSLPNQVDSNFQILMNSVPGLVFSNPNQRYPSQLAMSTQSNDIIAISPDPIESNPILESSFQRSHHFTSQLKPNAFPFEPQTSQHSTSIAGDSNTDQPYEQDLLGDSGQSLEQIENPNLQEYDQ